MKFALVPINRIYVYIHMYARLSSFPSLTHSFIIRIVGKEDYKYGKYDLHLKEPLHHQQIDVGNNIDCMDHLSLGMSNMYMHTCMYVCVE